MKSEDKVKNGDFCSEESGRKCPSCGLPVSDPFILLCPRCRAPLSSCTGCENCGACKKK